MSGSSSSHRQVTRRAGSSRHGPVLVGASSAADPNDSFYLRSFPCGGCFLREVDDWILVDFTSHLPSTQPCSQNSDAYRYLQAPWLKHRDLVGEGIEGQVGKTEHEEG